ncbi:uncharacterized protein MKZ38_002187 [Zalerion maritima]|uniref:Uncharacterized protein n=1 Tax=Zalerion maritima TaxID=339359 RepID=A0AAD5WSL0_9PEZI|nr:uncharacterized protein MKZ38_002187 [Zalerion maritima]
MITTSIAAAWSPSASCVTSDNIWRWILSGSSAYGVFGSPDQSTECFPDGYEPTGYFAGDSCPTDYTAACSRTKDGEVQVTCCPTVFDFSCGQSAPAASIRSTLRCVTSHSTPVSWTATVTDLVSDTEYTTFRTDSVGFNGYAIELRQATSTSTSASSRSTSPDTTGVADTGSVAADGIAVTTAATTATVATDSGNESSSTSAPSDSTSTSAAAAAGLSAAQSAGIGVGVSCGVIMAAVGAWLFFRRYRNSRNSNKPAGQGVEETFNGSGNQSGSLREDEKGPFEMIAVPTTTSARAFGSSVQLSPAGQQWEVDSGRSMNTSKSPVCGYEGQGHPPGHGPPSEPASEQRPSEMPMPGDLAFELPAMKTQSRADYVELPEQQHHDVYYELPGPGR